MAPIVKDFWRTSDMNLFLKKLPIQLIINDKFHHQLDRKCQTNADLQKQKILQKHLVTHIDKFVKYIITALVVIYYSGLEIFLSQSGNYMFKVNNRNTRTRCENMFKANKNDTRRQ